MLGIPTFSFCHTIFSWMQSSKNHRNLQNHPKQFIFSTPFWFPRNSPSSSEIHPPHLFFGQRHHCRVEAHPLSSFPCHNQPQRWWHQKYQVPCSQAEKLQSHPCCTSGFPVRGNRRNEILETEVQLYITICNNTCVYIYIYIHVMYLYLLIHYVFLLLYNVMGNGDDSLTLDSSSNLFCQILRPVDPTDSAVRRGEQTKKEP